MFRMNHEYGTAERSLLSSLQNVNIGKIALTKLLSKVTQVHV